MIRYYKQLARRAGMGRAIAPMALVLACAAPSSAASVNTVLENLFTNLTIPGTTVTTNDDIANGAWSFSETNMVGLSGGFDNNRHEFYFSEDGVSPLTIDGDTPWTVEFDIQLTSTLASPRKSFQFVVYHPTNAGQHSNINLTTNRSPAGATGGSAPPGESAMFNGFFNFLRLIGLEDGDPALNLNPTVTYTAGDLVHLKAIHVPSPDGGSTPGTIEHIYVDSSGTYTTGPRDLRNGGVFADGSRLGFLMQGIAHSGTGVDSYGATITNFSAIIGALQGDYNNDGLVDAADYTVWRDGDSPDDSQAGYDLWATNYGVPSSSRAAPIPEPMSALLLLVSLLGAASVRRTPS